jgi:hypothetical protein
MHTTTSGYPLRLTGELSPRLSRGLWLVKWLLAIPHLVVLFVLWIGFAVVSVVAFFAILFTRRYPRRLFDFNVGVLRWSWRVGFYSYSALGTDRYPPFSLADDPDYPARLEVEYPESLSRGLVLVKSWLLALPHYLVVGVFAGGAWAAWAGAGTQWVWTSGGLVGLLVLFAVRELNTPRCTHAPSWRKDLMHSGATRTQPCIGWPVMSNTGARSGERVSVSVASGRTRTVSSSPEMPTACSHALEALPSAFGQHQVYASRRGRSITRCSPATT